MNALSQDHVALGQAIRGLRLERRFSQEALAEAARMHRTYVGGVERGERNVSFANILRLASALDMPPSGLLQRYEAVASRPPRAS
jgi:transcriptional regulator with XRE-family HTH domain